MTQALRHGEDDQVQALQDYETRRSLDLTFTVLALGSRGDVQPVFILAIGIKRFWPRIRELRFVTHAEHKDFLTAFGAETGISIAFLPTSPLRPKDGSCEARKACRQERQDMLLHSHGADVILFNLFALEGYHIAECIGAVAIALSPCPLPHICPLKFQTAFARDRPALLRLFQCGDAIEGALGWSEVRHWMFSLFDVARWGLWRASGLGLGAIPFVDPASDLPVELPQSVDLLYGFSRHLFPRPGYWPSSAKVTGYWFSTKASQTDKVPSALRDILKTIDKANRQSPTNSGSSLLAVTFGSMGSLGLLSAPPYLEAFIRALLVACIECGIHAILIACGHNNLADAVRKVTRDFHGYSPIHLVAGSMPHGPLFARCQAVLHHGGAGTTAAAAAAGIPQIICPFMYDQFSWGQRIYYRGLGPAPLTASRNFLAVGDHSSLPLTADDIKSVSHRLRQALECCRKASVLKSCLHLAEALRCEDGVGVACRAIKASVLAKLKPSLDCALSGPGKKSYVRAMQTKFVPINLAQDLKIHAAFKFVERARMEHWEIFQKKIFTRCGVQFGQRSHVWDVGASIGCFSIFIDRFLRSRESSSDETSIVVFEQRQNEFDNLEANLRFHGLVCQSCVQISDVLECCHHGFTVRAVGPRVKFVHNVASDPNDLSNTSVSGGDPCQESNWYKMVLSREFNRRRNFGVVDLLKVSIDDKVVEVLAGIPSQDWLLVRQVAIKTCKDHVAAVVRLLRDTAHFSSVSVQDVRDSSRPDCSQNTTTEKQLLYCVAVIGLI